MSLADLLFGWPPLIVVLALVALIVLIARYRPSLLVRRLSRRDPSQRTHDAHLQRREIILDLLAKGHKIEAIKVYREDTGAGLKEAKDAVEVMAAAEGGNRR